MRPISILLTFSVIFITIGIRHYHLIFMKILSRVAFLLLLGFFVFFVNFPIATQKIADYFGVGRGADLLLYLLCVVTIGLGSLLIIKIREIENRFTNLVREIAILHSKKNRD